jgi:hypothetical protein
VDGDNVLVDNSRRRPSFPRESLSSRSDTCQMGCEHLDGYRPVEFRVEALQHDAHAAGTNDSLDLVASQPAKHLRVAGRTQEVQRHDRTPLSDRWVAMQAAFHRINIQGIAAQ